MPPSTPNAVVGAVPSRRIRVDPKVLRAGRFASVKKRLKLWLVSRSRGVALLGELVGLEAALLGLQRVQHVRHQRGRRLLLQVATQDELTCYFFGGHLCE